MKIKISHPGAEKCVTGSCHLIQTRGALADDFSPHRADSATILVDCGKAYGDDPELPFDLFPVRPEDIDYLFLTHAHIDHIGRLPDLIDAGFQGEIICTHATRALLIPMLHDALSYFKNLYAVGKYQDHSKLLTMKGPAIIIAGSGMCTGGRIVEHLKHGIDDPINDIFFVGYQAKGTPGRRIIEKKPVKAGIHTLTEYSAHTDQNTLIKWVQSMLEPPKEIRLVHGEKQARKALAARLGL